MCKIIHFKDLECKHRWARVVRPCTHGTGFSDCPSFTDPNYVRGTPRAYIARYEPCPVCDLGGEYDLNEVRMVVRVRKGIKIGRGPARTECGVEIGCCVM